MTTCLLGTSTQARQQSAAHPTKWGSSRHLSSSSSSRELRDGLSDAPSPAVAARHPVPAALPPPLPAQKALFIAEQNAAVHGDDGSRPAVLAARVRDELQGAPSSCHLGLACSSSQDGAVSAKGAACTGGAAARPDACRRVARQEGMLTPLHTEGGLKMPAQDRTEIILELAVCHENPAGRGSPGRPGLSSGQRTAWWLPAAERCRRCWSALLSAAGKSRRQSSCPRCPFHQQQTPIPPACKEAGRLCSEQQPWLCARWEMHQMLMV